MIDGHWTVHVVPGSSPPFQPVVDTGAVAKRLFRSHRTLAEQLRERLRFRHSAPPRTQFGLAQGELDEAALALVPAGRRNVFRARATSSTGRPHPAGG